MKTISDAIAKYKGVFPSHFSGDDEVDTNPPNAIAECIKQYGEDGVLFLIGELYPVYVPDFSLNYFRLVCTEKEFNAELKRLHTHGLEAAEPAQQVKTNDASVSIANLLNAQVSIANARKSSEFSEQNNELSDQADAILQAIIGNIKAERIPAEASFHLANAQNELNACAKLLEGDKVLADAVFCIGEKLAGIRKGDI